VTWELFKKIKKFLIPLAPLSFKMRREALLFTHPPSKERGWE